MPNPLLSILAFVAYILGALWLYQAMLQDNRALKTRTLLAVGGGLVAHALILAGYWFGPGPVDVSVMHILSACSWLMVLFLVLSRLVDQSLLDSGLVAFPLAALIVILDFSLPHSPMPLASMSPDTQIHVLSSVSAFAFFGIAAVYALFIMMLDRYLRHNRMTALVRALPALETLESLLMRLVLVGFTLLSIVLVSGLLFIDNLMAQHLAHKTILSVTAWALYGILLLGRWRFGWRGRTAVRLTLVATGILLVAYFGSKLVLEYILKVNWQV